MRTARAPDRAQAHGSVAWTGGEHCRAGASAPFKAKAAAGGPTGQLPRACSPRRVASASSRPGGHAPVARSSNRPFRMEVLSKSCLRLVELVGLRLPVRSHHAGRRIGRQGVNREGRAMWRSFSKRMSVAAAVASAAALAVSADAAVAAGFHLEFPAGTACTFGVAVDGAGGDQRVTRTFVDSDGNAVRILSAGVAPSSRSRTSPATRRSPCRRAEP